MWSVAKLNDKTMSRKSATFVNLRGATNTQASAGWKPVSILFNLLIEAKTTLPIIIDIKSIFVHYVFSQHSTYMQQPTDVSITANY